MMENSPRGISATPARSRPRCPMPALAEAHQPVAILAAAVPTPKAAASGSTPWICAGLICRPKKTKNTAANRSRSGRSNATALSATGPDKLTPTKNAPTVAETLSWAATPATSRVSPSTRSSSTSSLGPNTNRASTPGKRHAMTNTATTAPSARPRFAVVASTPSPEISAASTGR